MTEPFRVLSADPPWQFGDKLPGNGRSADAHYPTLPTHEIMRFPLPPLAKDSILYLWCVESMQGDALDVCKAWGFTVKTSIVWVKRTMAPRLITLDGEEIIVPSNLHFGMGHYTRAAHERCIVAVRGKPTVENKAIRSIIESFDETICIEGRVGRHSEKPAEFYALAEALTRGPYCELFARIPREGWSTFGNELPVAHPGSSVVVSPVTVTLKRPIADAYEMAGRIAAEALPDVADETDTICGDCHEPQFTTPSGITCPNGHGGAASLIVGVDLAADTFVERASGELPAHIIEDLRQHPSLVAEDERGHFVDVAKKTGLIDESLSANDAFIQLQYKAPKGWFALQRALFAANANGPDDGNMSATVGALDKLGFVIDLPKYASFDPVDRVHIKRWIRAGADQTKIAAALANQVLRRADTIPDEQGFAPSGCAACDRGTPVSHETTYLHTGTGGACASIAAPEPPQDEPPAAKPKRGRPKGSKSAKAAPALSPWDVSESLAATAADDPEGTWATP